MSRPGEVRVGTVHACPECGGMRPNDLSKPCFCCEQRKKDEEWQHRHPNPVKYLEEHGWAWQRLFMERGFPPDYAGPSKSVTIGWWNWHFCFVQQIYLTLVQAVKIQRMVDEGIKPCIIVTKSGVKIS